MFRRLPGLLVIVLMLPSRSLAEDIPSAEIVRVSGGMIVFRHEGKQSRLPVALALKLYDDQGQAVDVVTGTARYLLPGNIVNLKTRAKAAAAQKTKSKTKSKTGAATGEPEIIEIRFVSGKVAELPAGPDPNEQRDLRPDPNWKGNVFGGEGVKRDPYWIKYILTAKVGDFVEYGSGLDGKLQPHRQETMEVGKDYVIIARVWYLQNTRQEQREKHRVPPDAANMKGPRPAAESQELDVAGRKVRCDVDKQDGQPYRWRSTMIPYDGLVRTVVKGKVVYQLTNFGRGR